MSDKSTNKMWPMWLWHNKWWW